MKEAKMKKMIEDLDRLLETPEVERPEMLPEPVPYYAYKHSRHPDSIRMSFRDGSTAVYDIRMEQPHPLVVENIKTIRETEKNIKQGYVNRPQRKWRNK